MFKKFLATSMIGVISLMGVTSAFADDSSVNNVNLEIVGGDLELIMDDGDLNFEGIIDKSKSTIEIELQNDALSFDVIDNRGVDSTWQVQYTLDEFTHADEVSTLTATDESLINTPQTVLEGDPSVATEYTGEIDLEGLAFDNDQFVKAGNYSSELTTEVVVVGTP